MWLPFLEAYLECFINWAGGDIKIEIVPGSWCCRIREIKNRSNRSVELSTGENSTSSLSIPEADKMQRLKIRGGVSRVASLLRAFF
jgi:hypothetical protein